jgi:hypothetical protein
MNSRGPRPNPTSSPMSDPEPQSLPTPADLRERLLDLAYDASSYLRRSAKPAIRISAALLIAGSLAACSGEVEQSSATDVPPATVQPLAQEVRAGLPTAPGRYSVVPASIARDARGVYHFEWLDPTTNEARPATISSIRLAEAETNPYTLEVVTDGDPILHLERNAQIALSGSSSTSQSSGPGFMPIFWYPFLFGGGFGGGGGYRGPGYYDPPRTVPSGGRVEGSTSSTSPRPLPERTYGVTTSVPGRAGGTGGGVAASRRAGADTDTSATGGKSGVTAPRSGGFSSGSGGSAGSASS